MATAKKKSKAKKKAKAKKAPATKKVAKKAAKKPAKKAAKKAGKKPVKKTAKTTARKKLVKKASPKTKTAKKPAVRKASAAVKATKKAVKKAIKVAKSAVVKSTAPVKQTKTSSQKKSLAKWDSFFTPLDDRIVVIVDGPSERTAGGLYIPASVTSDRPNQGQVLAVGRGKKDKKGRIRPMDVKAGEKILFGSYAGMKMILNNQEVLMLREEDILGVMD